jgi:hypothetical protein
MASKRLLEEEQITQELYLHSDSDEALTSGDSDQTDSDTEVDRQNDRSKWNAGTKPTVPLVHRFTGCPSVLRLYEAPHIGKESTAISVFMLFFAEIIQLLVDETNRYYKQYAEKLDEGPAPLSDVTVQEIYLFIAIILQMGHDQRETH